MNVLAAIPILTNHRQFNSLNCAFRIIFILLLFLHALSSLFYLSKTVRSFFVIIQLLFKFLSEFFSFRFDVEFVTRFTRYDTDGCFPKFLQSAHVSFTKDVTKMFSQNVQRKKTKVERRPNPRRRSSIVSGWMSTYPIDFQCTASNDSHFAIIAVACKWSVIVF